MHACTGRHAPESTTGGQSHTREPASEMRMEQERRGRAGLVLGPAPALSCAHAVSTLHAQHQIKRSPAGTHGRMAHAAAKTRSQPQPQARGTRTGGDKRAACVRAPRCTGTCPACTLRHVGLARFFSRPARLRAASRVPSRCCCCEIDCRGQLSLANCSPPGSAVTVLNNACMHTSPCLNLGRHVVCHVVSGC